MASTPRAASIINKNPATAKNVTLYKNGDVYFGGRRFVINQRENQKNNMGAFLEHATEVLKPSFGAVRNIYTPDGGSRVKSLADIQSGRSYVAAGNENFRCLANRGLKYQEIGTKKPRAIKKTYSHIKPFSHNTHFGQVSGRWKQAAQEINQPVQLWLHVNGDSQSSPVRLLLPSRILKLKWEMLLEYVTDRVGIRLGHAVRKLFTIEGDMVTGAKKMITGRTYIACGSERFRQLSYKTGGSGLTGPPVLKRKPLPPIGIKKMGKTTKTEDYHEENEEYDNIVEKMQADKNNKKGGKKDDKRKLHGDDDEVFAGKAVHVKAKTAKKGGKKGGENYVDEDPNMKTDVPIEMQKAAQVGAKKKGKK